MTTAPGFVRRITKGGVKTLRGLLGIEGVGQTLEPVESVSLCISVVLVYSSENNPMHIYYLHTYLSTTTCLNTRHKDSTYVHIVL